MSTRSATRQFNRQPSPIPAYDFSTLNTLLREVREVKALLLEQQLPNPKMYFSEIREKLGKPNKPIGYGKLNRLIKDNGVKVEGDTGGKYINRNDYMLLR